MFSFIVSSKHQVGDYRDEVTPVPMPNTEVKLIFAENTRLATARKHRSSPTLHAPLAQMVEQLTLNQWVPGSSP